MNLAKHWAARLDDYAIDLAWSPDGAMLAVASAAGPISVFAADGAKTAELPGHEGGTNALAWASVFVPHGGTSTRLSSGGQDGAVKLWDALAGQNVSSASLGPTWVEHLAWSPGNPLLAAACGRSLCLLNREGALAHRFPDAPKTISAIAWSPDGALVAAGGFGGIRIWDAGTYQLRKDLPYANAIHALAWSPDGKWLVSGNQDPSVHLWIPSSDEELHMSGYETKVRHLSFDRTSRWLATSGGRDASVWDCSGAGPEGRAPSMLPHDAPVCSVAFQRSHGLLATASQDGALNVWSPERPQPLRASARMSGATSRLDWSPDDRFLAIGSENGTVYVLRCEN